MKQLRKIFFLTTIIFLLLMQMTICLAENIDTTDYNPDKFVTNSDSVILMDPKTGNILYSKNAFEKKYPASTTKLMTAILTLENCKLDDVVTISRNAIYSIPVGYSHAYLKEGEQLTVENLLNVLLIPSANDAAVALAEHIAGSVEDFSKMMNEKAKELGCLNTNFVNPNGVHDSKHYSTAYDLALIGQYAMKFEDILRIAKISEYTLPTSNKYNKENRFFTATNGLITKDDEYYYSYATGLKTGYTDKSGYCIVATAKKNNEELLEVVLDSESMEERYEDCINLFNYGFENYSNKKLVSKNEIIKSITVSGATKETKNLDVIAKNDINVLLKNDININSLDKNVEIYDVPSAPVSEGAVLGKISYTINDKTYSTELIAANSVEATSFELIVFRIALIFLILYLFTVIFKKINNFGNKNKSKKNNIHKSIKKPKKRKPKTGGKFKFTQINEYL